MTDMPELSLLDRVKVQAEVLVPLVHALETELGKERAHALVARTLAEHFRRQAEGWWVESGRDLDTFMAAWSKRSGSESALRVEVRRFDREHMDFDVTDCKYARFWQEIGEPEIGFLLQCSADFAVDGAVEPLHLTRTQTRMQGADHCDFRIRFDRAEPSAEGAGDEGAVAAPEGAG